jgi:hypothetical protein
MKFETYINESSLSRVWKHNELHDCGALTAFREAKDCGAGDKYTKKENLTRNKSLLAKLMVKGYNVTKLNGIYPEGGKESREVSYFVVDVEDTGNLENTLKQLGEYFEQDSILFIPKGAILNLEKAYLIGTNKCKNNWLGYGNKEIFKKGSKIGYKSEIYTSYVNGRPFIFECVDEEVYKPGNGFGWISLNNVASKDWWELIE